MGKLIKRKNYKRHYYLVKEENRFVVVWEQVKDEEITDVYMAEVAGNPYYGRYLDDPEYDLHTYYEYELSKPKMTFKLFWLILKFRIYDYQQRH